MRILYITPWFPYPPVNGSKLRIFNLIKTLSRRHEIELLAFIRPNEEIDFAGVYDLCGTIETIAVKNYEPNSIKAIGGYLSSKPRHLADTYNPKIKDKIVHNYHKFNPDYMVFSQLGTIIYRPKITTVPCCFDELEISILSNQMDRTRGSLQGFRAWLTWLKSSAFIRKSVPYFSFCTAVSEIEKVNIQKILPNYQPIYVIPNGVDTDFNKPTGLNVQPKSLIYTGSLTYSANYDAMHFFLSEIFPIVRTRIPESKLRITGSYHEAAVNRLQLDGCVELTGHLPDIRPALSSSWICIVPLRIGGGTRLKILEAMSMGTPVISTSKGAEGLEVSPDKDILIADKPEDFASKIIQLFSDVELRTQLSVNGRRLVESRYDWQPIGETFNSLIEKTSKCRV